MIKYCNNNYNSSKAGKIPNKKVLKVSESIKKWIDKDGKKITNKNGDLVLISKNGNRRVRFDLKNPYPHSNPHSHVEELVNGIWIKAKYNGVSQLYPKDVPKK